MVVANNQMDNNKKCRQIAGNLMAMRMQWYDAWCIAQ